MSAYPSHQFRLYSFKGKIVTLKKKEEEREIAQRNRKKNSVQTQLRLGLPKLRLRSLFIYSAKYFTVASRAVPRWKKTIQLLLEGTAAFGKGTLARVVSCRTVPCSTVPSLSIQRRSQMRQSYILYTRSQKESIPSVAGGDSQQSCLGEAEWTRCLGDCQYKKYPSLNSYFECEYYCRHSSAWINWQILLSSFSLLSLILNWYCCATLAHNI